MAYIGRRASHLFGAYNINQAEIYRNGFLDAYNVVARGGESALINQLFGPDSRRQAGESGSQFVRRQFATEVQRNSVAAIAADAAGRLEAGVPVSSARAESVLLPRLPAVRDAQLHRLERLLDLPRAPGLVQRKFARGSSPGLLHLSKSLDTRAFDPAFTTVGTGSAQSASSTPFDNSGVTSITRPRTSTEARLHRLRVWDLPFGRGRCSAAAPRGG